MPCVLSSRTQARFSTRFMKLSWVQLKFFWACCFLQEEEDIAVLCLRRKAECRDPDNVWSYFLVGWKVAFLLFLRNILSLSVIGEHKAVSWAGMGSFGRWLENHQQDGSFKKKKGLIIKRKKKSFVYKITSVTPLLCRPVVVLVMLADLCAVKYNWLRSGVLQALVLSSDSNLVTVRFQAKCHCI